MYALKHRDEFFETYGSTAPLAKSKHWVLDTTPPKAHTTYYFRMLAGFGFTAHSNLGACGATVGSSCSGWAFNDTDSKEIKERRLQEFCFHLHHILGKRTLFFLPVTYQLPLLNQEGSFLWCMKMCGAKEVHRNPNRLHGPNEMVLMVLDPGCPEALKAKELYLEPVTGISSGWYSDPVVWVPKYIVEIDKSLDESAPKEVELPKTIPTMQKPAGPVRSFSMNRDSLGRFISTK